MTTPGPALPHETGETEHATATLGSGAMFDAIADRYDTLNRILSLGIDQSWRRKAASTLALREGAKVLDVGTGTGDLALVIARANPTVEIIGVDPAQRMLEIGRHKVARAGLEDRVRFQVGGVEQLPFDSASFDAATIAFGIRNVRDRALGLREMARVVRPGGRVVVLELGEPEDSLLGPFARFHVRQVVPRLGGLLSGKREYRYLQQSIEAFPAPDAFARMMEQAGLVVREVRRLTWGACNLFVGERQHPPDPPEHAA